MPPLVAQDYAFLLLSCANIFVIVYCARKRYPRVRYYVAILFCLQFFSLQKHYAVMRQIMDFVSKYFKTFRQVTKKFIKTG